MRCSLVAVVKNHTVKTVCKQVMHFSIEYCGQIPQAKIKKKEEGKEEHERCNNKKTQVLWWKHVGKKNPLKYSMFFYNRHQRTSHISAF